MNDCPTALHRANIITKFITCGWSTQKAKPSRNSLKATARKKETVIMLRFVYNIKSNGLGVIPIKVISDFSLF